MLSPRADAILRTIVGRYITDAIPVSSQSLISDGELDVSSATIRNEMVRLEKSGYIIRPYTSAGSVPTDMGYRYYVESLSSVSLPAEEQRLIGHLFHQVERRLDEWLTLAATLLARMSHNVALVTEPKPLDCKFKHMEIVALQTSSALLVLVLNGATVKQRLLTFQKPVLQSELSDIAGKLRAGYAGLSAVEISAKAEELAPEEQIVKDCVVEMMAAEDNMKFSEPYFDGLHYMLNQPEFIHNPRVAEMVEMVEQKSVLSTILPVDAIFDGIRVVIGKENRAEIAHDYSLVLGRYGLAREVMGTIGVIGPTRMPYGRTISAVSYVSRVLSRLMRDLYKGEEISEFNAEGKEDRKSN